jgi:hypothetical protein
MPTIKIKISPDGGKVQVGVDGVSGESCVDLTAGIEAAMLGAGSTQELTDEFYQQPGVDIQESI